MKIIHTSDWHIGKIIYETNLIEEQKYILDQFLKIIDDERPDAIIIAGDLYDRAVPSKEAVNLLDEVLNQIIMDKKIPVLTIAGNHDSAERLEFASRILERHQLFISGKLKNEVQVHTFKDAHGDVHFYMMPFASLSEMKVLLEDEEIRTYDEACKAFLSRIQDQMDKHSRNVLITHGYYVTQGETLEMNDSVRPLTVGTTEYVDVSYLEDFDYVALGHIHKPQKVKGDHIRYCGSLMKYSFSEVHHQKGVVIIEMGKKGEQNIRFQPLNSLRDLKEIKGTFDALMNLENKEAFKEHYIRAILTDDNPIYDAISSLRAVYPHILRMDYQYRAEGQMLEGQEAATSEKKTDMDLFEEFYMEMTGKSFDEAQTQIVTHVFSSMLEGGDRS